MKAKQDRKGVYVRVDGWIARRPPNSEIQAGDEVVASHPGGPLAKVRPSTAAPRSGQEFWELNGPYWWHPVEGRGAQAGTRRENDRQRWPEVYLPEREYTASYVAEFYRVAP
jgi:hypothetical protein